MIKVYLAVVFFVDLQKTFDTVDHDILLDKLEHCGVREIANKWFETYLKDMQQFFPINCYNSECASLPIGVPQKSVPDPLLFLLHINDPNLALNTVKFIPSQMIQIHYILMALLKN